MRLSDEKSLLERMTIEQARQNIALLKAEEIEMPKKWVLELLNTIEALQQENERLQAQVANMSNAIQKYILSIEKQYNIEDHHKCPICGIFTKAEYCHMCVTKKLINAMSDVN